MTQSGGTDSCKTGWRAGQEIKMGLTLSRGKKMRLSLDSASKVAEIIGLMLIVLSFALVGFEVRQNTPALRFISIQAFVSEYDAGLREFAAHTHVPNQLSAVSPI